MLRKWHPIFCLGEWFDCYTQNDSKGSYFIWRNTRVFWDLAYWNISNLAKLVEEFYTVHLHVLARFSDIMIFWLVSREQESSES